MARRRMVPEPVAQDPSLPKLCDVRKCKEKRNRSLPLKKVTEALPSLKWRKDLGTPRRVLLCRVHYREFRKTTKEARKLDMLGRG